MGMGIGRAALQHPEMPDIPVLILCIVFTLIWARVAAVFANKASPKTLNRATGVVLAVLGLGIMIVNFVK